MGAQKISPQFLQTIRDRVNLVDVVGQHVVLRKTGANHTGLCPFHSERTPSFSVNEAKQLFYCYGCKRGGDLFAFVMEVHAIEFTEAVEELAERCKIELPQNLTEANPKSEKDRRAARERLRLAYRLNRFAAAFYYRNLMESGKPVQYLRRRGVNDELIRNFYLGTAPPSWDSLARHLFTKKAPLSLAAELGLIRLSPKSRLRMENDTGYFDLFRNRVIFPILDHRGRIVGFGGRSLPGEVAGPCDNPKYMNSTESFLFQKGKILFGMYQAQKYIRERGEAILVEGYFDLLALHSAGFRNVVASCGTSLTTAHLGILGRLASRIILLFDGDQAGVQATERAMEIGLESGIVIFGASVPTNHDPDEILFDQETGAPIPGGTEAIAEILKLARPLLDFRIQEEVRSASDSMESRTLALKKIGGWLRKFKDPLGKEVRIEALQTQLKIPRSLVVHAMGREDRGMPMPAAFTKNNSTSLDGNDISFSDRILLGGLVGGGECARIIREARDKVPPGLNLFHLFDDVSVRGFVQSLLETPERLERPLDIPQAIDHLPSADRRIRTILTETTLGIGNRIGENDVRRALDRSLSRVWARFSHRIREALGAAEAKKDAELHARLMKDYLDVQRKMKEFISFYDEA